MDDKIIKPFHTCEVSDSFVHPTMKLSEGKNGNGESRLFISTDKDITNQLVKKEWILNYDSNYIEDVSEFVNNDKKFRQINPNRYNDMQNNISKLQESSIEVQLQQGSSDIRRNYIAQIPHRKTKGKTKIQQENIKKWDDMRKSLVPTITTIQFYDKEEHFLINIIHNKNVHKYNKLHGCSFVSLEFFKKFEKTNNIEIQTAKNGGEHKERKDNGYFWPVDGYHNCDKHNCDGNIQSPCIWNNYVFEFQGDYWHKDKKTKDLEKRNFYINKRYKWFEITEFEWNNREKILKILKK